MTKWGERKRAIKASLDFDPLNTIPMLEGAEVSLVKMQQRIREEFDKNRCERITVIDPYFLPSDIDFIIHSFASLKGRSLTIITKLADVENQCNSAEHEANFRSAIKEIEDKKIFAAFKVYKTNKPIHDRYILATDLNEVAPCFSLGTSINMLFKRYSCVARVSNNSFKRKIQKLADVCIADSIDL